MPDDVIKPETVALHGDWRADPTTGSGSPSLATGASDDYVRLSVGLEQLNE